MAYAYVDAASGRINAILQWDTNDPQVPPLANPGELVIGAPPEATNEGHYYDGTAIIPMPLVPEPVVSDGGHRMDWADPPVGLTARVYDLWIQPPHLLAEALISAPDAGLYLVAGGNDYRIDLTADFPWLPRTLEVNL